jgi:hypothetical protein
MAQTAQGMPAGALQIAPQVKIIADGLSLRGPRYVVDLLTSCMPDVHNRRQSLLLRPQHPCSIGCKISLPAARYICMADERISSSCLPCFFLHSTGICQTKWRVLA